MMDQGVTLAIERGGVIRQLSEHVQIVHHTLPPICNLSEMALI